MSSAIEKAARDLAASFSAEEHSTNPLVQALVEAVREGDSDPDGKKAEYRKIAINDLQKDGELEIDPDAVVSISEDGGAYVQAWVWVQD